MRSRSTALRRLTLAAACWLVCRPGLAVAQSRAGDDDLAAVRERLDPATRQAVLAIIDSSAAAGVPTDPLAAKALEGDAKRAPGDRIVAAVRALAVDLGVARRELGATADEPSLLAAASALRSGVPAEALRELRAARGTATAAWPLSVLSDLVRRGVPADTAANVVLSLARRGAPDPAFTVLLQQVAGDIGAGIPPGAAAAARAPAGGARKPPVLPPAAAAPPSGSRPHVAPPASPRRP